MRRISKITSVIAVSLVAGLVGLGQDPPQQPQRCRDLNVVCDTIPKEHTPPRSTVPHSYALVVGIAHYTNLPAKGQLQYADRDAEDIYSTLISQQGGNFPAENVHKLINEQATLRNLREELEQWLPSITGPDDRVLIYFAGHGFVSSGKPYLAPNDVDVSHLAQTALPMDELGRDIGTQIHGKWKVLITDACHSGAITPEDDAVRINSSLLQLNTSLFSLTASRDREQSYESPQWGGGHGIFTYYVIRGLEGEADESGDGIVTADELADYVRTNVRLATKTLQNPTSDRGSFDPQMVLAFNPGQSAKCKGGDCPMTPRFGTFVIQTNMDGVEVWLDNKSLGVINKSQPQRFPGITPGPHTVKGVHIGYEPDGPRDEEIYPGQDTTVNIRILIAKQRNRAAQIPFDKGMELYARGFAKNYEEAALEFKQALQLDPNYGAASLYLGRTYQALYQSQLAATCLKHAVEIEPDYSEARLSYAAALLDTGDLQEAVRQSNAVIQRDPANGMAWYLTSQAFAREGAYEQAIEAGRKAVAVTPGNGEAHLWLAEALRQKQRCGEAIPEYNRYLDLSKFDDGVAGKLSYYVLGALLGAGSKRRASQEDIWREQRAQADVGICDCQWMQKNFETAGAFCLKALMYDHNEPYANYRLGVVYLEEYNDTLNATLLREARQHFSSVVAQIPNTDEGQRSQRFVAKIDAALRSR